MLVLRERLVLLQGEAKQNLLILFEILGIGVSEDDITKTLNNRLEIKDIVKKFYGKNVEICVKHLDFLVYMINNKLIKLNTFRVDFVEFKFSIIYRN